MLGAVEEAATIHDVSTYTYMHHIPGVKYPLADAVSRAQWKKVAYLTHPFPVRRLQLPASWVMRWL